MILIKAMCMKLSAILENYSQTIAISVDLSLLVFLWIVQLILYPSFKKISKEHFSSWHKYYQSSVLIIMGPIMLTQIFMICSSAIIDINKINILRLIMLAIAWFWTLLVSIPCHQKIKANFDIEKTINLLIKTNWMRTFVWTGIFISNFLR